MVATRKLLRILSQALAPLYNQSKKTFSRSIFFTDGLKEFSPILVTLVVVNISLSLMYSMKAKLILFFICITVFSACDQNSNKADKAGSDADVSVPPFIIDAHVHYKPTDEWEKSFVDVYTKHNAMGCVMVRMEELERGIEFAKANPDRVIPYAMIDIDAPDVLEDVKRVHAIGYKGLGNSLPEMNGIMMT
jgi:hypothetical protein